MRSRGRMKRSSTVWTVVAVAVAIVGDAAAQENPAKAAMRQRPSVYPVPPGAVAAASIPETEGNDTPGEADPLSLGDEATGEIDPAGDVDYFAFFVTAGVTVEMDVSAREVGSPLDATLELFGTDGMTSLAFNDDDAGSLDSRIVFTFGEDGVFFVAVRAFLGGGGPGQFYTLAIDALEPGPGDPTTLFAGGLRSPSGMAFDDAGDLFVSELSVDLISRVTRDGSVSTFATGIPSPAGLAFDPSGNLLVAAREAVYRIAPDGTPSPFIVDVSRPWGLAVARDGDIWVVDTGRRRLRRYDSSGTPRESFDMQTRLASPEAHLAFSPDGDLYISNGVDEVLRLVDGQVRPFIRTEPYIESMAFDTDGYLYVANGFLGEILLYSPEAALEHDPFARTNLGGPITLAFGRDTQGRTEARLFASNAGYGLQPPFIGSIVEVNAEGIRAPGWPVAARVLTVSPEALPDGVMGADYTAQLSVTEADASPRWSLASGTLPPGIDLDPTTGTLAGVAEAAGVFSFGVRAEAESRVPGTREYAISVAEPALSLGDAADELLGSVGVLSPDQRRFLDLLGNRNGDFDVGDFRAFVISRTTLASPDAAPNRTSRKESP